MYRKYSDFFKISFKFNVYTPSCIIYVICDLLYEKNNIYEWYSGPRENSVLSWSITFCAIKNVILLIPYSKRTTFCKIKYTIFNSILKNWNMSHSKKNLSCVRKNIHVLRKWVIKLTFNWAKAVKAVTKASSSSVSAVFMDTLMMWIGFSLVFCRGWKRNLWLQTFY